MSTGVVKLPLTAIQMDTSIQCRANIDTATVGEYAERMQEGDVFPPIDVYGTEKKCWIGDGWHRVLASLQFGFLDITATMHPGGRAEALRHALSANAEHGLQRTNADKRRSVENALREWPNESSREIAAMCGVSHTFVDAMKPEQVATVATSPSTVTGRDGKQYPAHRQPKDERPSYVEPGAGAHFNSEPELGPPQRGLQMARLAIMDLDQITMDDLEREAAFDHVQSWLDRQRQKDADRESKSRFKKIPLEGTDELNRSERETEKVMRRRPHERGE